MSRLSGDKDVIQSDDVLKITAHLTRMELGQTLVGKDIVCLLNKM